MKDMYGHDNINYPVDSFNSLHGMPSIEFKLCKFGWGQTEIPMSKIANIDQEHNFDLDNNTVTLDDLSEGQRCELEQEVEVEIAELREHKLIRLQKTKNSVIAKQQKPINLELSANEKEVAMLDLSGNIGPFVLPAEFRAKEVDEHLDDGSRNRDDKAEILESHQ
uniref:Uncharacterized protein n=2 Tax=Oryza sativa subsp. japonica TaxID=39947 RepID=Q6YWG2_ORYSJ|nr:hypothetical protein [Oryza sativa Japonica Group]BAD10641.1 hypothetical protein [Oryza sativa Japonica Group]